MQSYRQRFGFVQISDNMSIFIKKQCFLFMDFRYFDFNSIFLKKPSTSYPFLNVVPDCSFFFDKLSFFMFSHLADHPVWYRVVDALDRFVVRRVVRLAGLVRDLWRGGGCNKTM